MRQPMRLSVTFLAISFDVQIRDSRAVAIKFFFSTPEVRPAFHSSQSLSALIGNRLTSPRPDDKKAPDMPGL